MRAKIYSDLDEGLGFGLVIDNDKWHHKALRLMAEDWGKYRAASEIQSALLNGSVPTQALEDISENCSKCRAQFCGLCAQSDKIADNTRFVLMTPAGVVAFQRAEYLSSQMKEHLVRLPETVSGKSTSVHGLKVALEENLKTTPKCIVRGCISAAEHFREAGIACAQSASSGGTPLSLQMVERLVIKNRRAAASGEMRKLRDVGSYQNEHDIVQAMLNEHAGAIRVG